MRVRNLPCRIAARSLPASAAAALLAAQPALAAGSQPAKGASVTDLALGAGVGGVLTVLLLWVAIRHRTGRTALLTRMAGFSERVSGLPGWCALPSGIAGASALIAVFGFYWDVAKHIDTGRDPSPFGTAAHYPILVGLAGLALAGVIGIMLGTGPGGERARTPTSLRLARDWHVPLGSALIFLCGAFALSGFPLDDVWHRLFGQDVTLWGPTHLMLIGGAGMSLIGMAVLLGEGMWARRRQTDTDDRAAASEPAARIVTLRRLSLMGGLLIGLSTFQAEFDFGVPQFRMIFQPLLIAWAAGFALVAARLFVGRGGALGAVAFFWVVRGGVSLIVGPVLGEATPALPLYLPEALVVELAALVLARRIVPFAVVSGVLAGTVGLAAEYGWTHVLFRVPMTGDILPEAIVVSVVAGIGGALMGALLGSGLRGRLPRPGLARPMAAIGLVAIAACVADGLILDTPANVRAIVATTGSGPTRDVTVRFDPDVADGAAWATATAWQDGKLVVKRLERVGPATYRATGIPVTGDWKALVRVHYGRALLGAPIRLPEDTAIPARAVPAPDRAVRPMVRDLHILQRERKRDVPGWLTTVAPLVVLMLALGFAGALAWGVGRTGRHDGSAPTPPAPGVSGPSRFARRPPAATPQPS
ncbi:MAG: hypothetical protein ABR581_09825 [Thermoleophilaceae bacterium]